MPDTDGIERDEDGRPLYAPVAGHFYGTKPPKLLDQEG